MGATTGKITFTAVYTGGPGGGVGGGGGGDDRQAAAGEINDADLTMPDGSPIPEGPEGDAIRAELKASGAGRKRRKPHGLPDKPTDFQIRVKVIKARHLPGSNIDATVRVS